MTLIAITDYMEAPLYVTVTHARRGDLGARAALRKRAETDPAARAEYDLLLKQ